MKVLFVLLIASANCQNYSTVVARCDFDNRLNICDKQSTFSSYASNTLDVVKSYFMDDSKIYITDVTSVCRCQIFFLLRNMYTVNFFSIQIFTHASYELIKIEAFVSQFNLCSLVCNHTGGHRQKKINSTNESNERNMTKFKREFLSDFLI